MQKIKPESYSDYTNRIDDSSCGKVYPLSIAELIQSGDIYVSSCKDNRSVLYWHYCGFAFIYGVCDESFLEEVYGFMSDKKNTADRRFVLFADSKPVERFFRAKSDTVIEERYFFEYAKSYSGLDAAVWRNPINNVLC